MASCSTHQTAACAGWCCSPNEWDWCTAIRAAKAGEAHQLLALSARITWYLISSLIEKAAKEVKSMCP
jgi:hypothetical protein